MEKLALLGGTPVVCDTAPEELFKWPIITKEDEEAVLDIVRTNGFSNFDRTIEYADYPAKVEKRNRRRPLIPDCIGRVVKSVNGTSGSYTMQKDDLYIRAVVYSDVPSAMQNAFYPQQQCAWIQPVKNSK